MGGVPRHRLQRHRHHTLHLRVADLARSPGPRLVKQAIAPGRDKAPPPLADRDPRRAQPLRDRDVAFPGGTGKHDPGA